MPISRHYFPGNNTPQGFFSYYDYILRQREAEKIVCIKGGPGTGKSTFLKKIAEKLVERGIDVDYLHCSADANSLDGISLPDRKIAFIDGTSPHIIDPKTPGAVDSILNFGEYWDTKGFDENKETIISQNEESSRWYSIAYYYMGAAKEIYNILSKFNDEAVEISEIYKISKDIIQKEYQDYDIAYKSGHQKKFFASAITPDGVVSYLKTLIEPVKKIYIVNVPEGYNNRSFMEMLMQGALYRGFDIECFYCPMDPTGKVEHFIVPDLDVAFVSTNKWHDIEAWEVSGEGVTKDITLIDICDYRDMIFVEKNKDFMERVSKLYSFLLGESIFALKQAKLKHLEVESEYIPNMNFEKIDELVEITIENIV